MRVPCDNTAWLLIATGAARAESGGALVSGGDIDHWMKLLAGYAFGVGIPHRLECLANADKVELQYLPVRNKRGAERLKPRYGLTEAGVQAVYRWAREQAHDAEWRIAHDWPEARPIPKEERVRW